VRGGGIGSQGDSNCERVFHNVMYFRRFIKVTFMSLDTTTYNPLLLEEDQPSLLIRRKPTENTSYGTPFWCFVLLVGLSLGLLMV
jgi:hypothetical protein